MEHTFQYRSHIQEIHRIRKDLEFLKLEWKLKESDTRQILVIVEELFSNITRYAFDDKKEHEITIGLSHAENEIGIEFVDDGVPFNPLEYQTQPTDDPALSDAGGMGLTLIGAFSSNISYHRSSGKNHLTITKKIKSK
jgi:serine/threonine-protein kinase RsbW